MFLPLLVFFCIAVLSAQCRELPSYFPKCSISDPNLSQCIMDNGNAVIPRLVQGEATLAIPAISPLRITETLMEGNNLTIECFNVYTDDLKNFRLTNVTFDLKAGSNISLEGYINRFTATGENFNILSGNILGFPAYGNGNFTMTLIGVSLRSTSYITMYQRGGETYINLVPVKFNTDVIRAYFNYENIESPCIEDVNCYIDQHWEEYIQQLRPALNIQFGAYLNYALHMITTKLPVSKIFLP